MKQRPKYGHLIKWIFGAIDLIALNVAYIVTILVKCSEMNVSMRLVWLVLNVSYIVVAYYRLGIHDRRVLYADRVVLQALKSVALHAGIFLSIISFLGVMLPLKGVLMLYALFSIFLTTWWLISRKLLKIYRKYGFNYQNIIIVGDGSATKRFLEEVTGDMGYGYHVEGLFGCSKDLLPNIYHGELEDVSSFVKSHQVDEMYCAIHDNREDGLTQMIRIAEMNAIDFFYLPQLGPTVTRNFALTPFGNVPVLSVMPHPGQKSINRAIKRITDIVISLIALILFPFIFIPVAIGIKCTSQGPIFFKQKRTGYRGKEFMCYKFRTMSVGHKDNDGMQVSKNDPGVTRIGRFLRHYSIDELPQFFNVLKGDMSVVGPRPHMVEHTEMYRKLIDKYMLRHLIKPGITGWAQVCGYRGETDELWKMEKRIECDVWYAENWNFMLDAKIILLTIINVFKGDKNAY